MFRLAELSVRLILCLMPGIPSLVVQAVVKLRLLTDRQSLCALTVTLSFSSVAQQAGLVLWHCGVLLIFRLFFMF